MIVSATILPFLWHHFLCLTRYTFCRAFLTTLNELNDYAGQHEVIAENLTSQIITELSRYLQELKSERKSVRHLFMFRLGCALSIANVLFLVLYLNFVHIILLFSTCLCIKSNIYFRQADMDTVKENRNAVLKVSCIQCPFAYSILHELRSSLSKYRYTQRLARSAERDWLWVLFMEQSHRLCVITGLFLSFKPTYKRLVHHTLFLNVELTFFFTIIKWFGRASSGPAEHDS